ncbi:MAG: cytochrome c family protein [Hyphomicrobium sp.]|uniref:c-type cytochrome n=1 Tax=Hyphomicrobium sp. TaxID=82 RepID=UPI003D0D41E8
MLKWVLAVAALVAVPVTASAQDVEAGGTVFKKCAACHTIEAGKPSGLGPNLNCVDGRPAASQADFADKYSPALKGAGITWDDAKLLEWMENDDKVVPGNKMIFPARVKDETDRTNLLAYIKAQCKK